MLLCSYIQLIKLFSVNAARRISQKALPPLCLWKRNHIADIICTGKYHRQPVKAESDTAMGSFRWDQ
jgi:hypothetical protein